MNRAWLWAPTVAGCLVVGAGLFAAVALRRLSGLEREVVALTGEVRSLRSSRGSPKLDAGTGPPAAGRGANGNADDNSDVTSELEFCTTAEAADHVKELGSTPTADKLAEALMTLDSWIVKADEEEKFREFKLELASRLRARVKQEVLSAFSTS